MQNQILMELGKVISSLKNEFWQKKHYSFHKNKFIFCPKINHNKKNNGNSRKSTRSNKRLSLGNSSACFLFGTHIFLTISLKFIQRFIGKAIKISFSKKKEGEGDISQFGAMTTALAATIGTGNIVGVATAVASGGPGAVLWMWLTGVFGIATKYSEALLSVKYRVTTKDGLMAGGPMYVLEKGMNNKFLAVTFAALTAVTAFGIGNMVQANSYLSFSQ